MTFKLGDLVRVVSEGRYCGSIFTIIEANESRIFAKYYRCMRGTMRYGRQFEEWELVLETNKPKFKVGSAVQCINPKKFAGRLPLGIVITSNRIASMIRMYLPVWYHSIEYVSNCNLRMVKDEN